jgi:hypothetical protein
MAGSGARPTAHELSAQTIAKQAMEGDLPKIGEYRLRDRGEYQTVGIPNILLENSEAVPGEDDLTIYGDLSLGFAVIDLNGNIGDGGVPDA